MASALTLEAVQDALKAVLSRGEYPSMAKVRAELDTTASQQTLTRHMKAALQGVAEQMGTGLPEGLPGSVVDAAHRFYTEARESAREELERQRALMAEREQRLTEEAEQAHQKASALEQQLGHLQQRAQAAESERDALSTQLDEKDTALSDSQARQSAAANELAATRTQTARDLRQLRASHRQAILTLTRERDAMSAARDREIARADEQQKAWASEIDQARQATKIAETKAAEQARELGQARDQALAQRDEYAASVRDTEQRLRQAQSEQQAETKRAESAEASAQQAQDQAGAASERLTTVQSEHNALREELARVTAIADERERLLDRLDRSNESTPEKTNKNAGKKTKK